METMLVLTAVRAKEDTALLAGALEQLMRYLLSGCAHSAKHATYLLDRLSTHPELGEEMQDVCDRMCEFLENAATRSGTEIKERKKV